MKEYAISGYEGLYTITKCGKVFANEKFVKRLGRDGKYHYIFREKRQISLKKRGPYLAVLLYTRHGKRKMISVHRVVAKEFLPNPDNLPVVNHKDENGHNNRVGNLEWCTHEYNQTYSRGKETTLISPRGEVVTRQSQNSFCREFGLSVCGVWRLYNGKQKQTQGWRLP